MKLNYSKAVLIVLLILIIDQITKFYIKTNFAIGDYITVFENWFKIYFIENEGMAFGMRLGDAAIGKVILTLFRLIAVSFGFYYLSVLIKKYYNKGLIICAALILAGATGNLIDSLFYGMIFTESNFGQVAQLVSFGEGYAPFLHGKVVDMLYFPLIDTIWPDWVPYFGGKPLRFFEPIFNIADASISIGVIVLLLFQRRFLPQNKA